MWDSETGDRTVDELSVVRGNVTLLNTDEDGTSSRRFNLTANNVFILDRRLALKGIQLTVQQDVDIDFATLTVDGSAVAGSSLIVDGDLTASEDGVLDVLNGGMVDIGGSLLIPILSSDESGSGIDIEESFVSVAGPIVNNDRILLDDGATLVTTAGITNNELIFLIGSDNVIDGSVANFGTVNQFSDVAATITGDLIHSAERLSVGLTTRGPFRIAGRYNGGSTFNSSFEPDEGSSVVVVAGEYQPADVTEPETGSVEFAGTGLQLESSTTTTIDLAAVDDHDQISAFTTSVESFFGDFIVDPNVTLAGDLEINLLDGFTLDADQSFQIIDFDSNGTISGTFAGLPEGAVVLTDNGFDLVISYVGGDGDDVVLTTVVGGDDGGGHEPIGQLNDGLLTLSGTPDNDTISLTQTGPDQVTLTLNDYPAEIFDGVEDVTVFGLAGDDTINVDFPGATIEGGTGDDEITFTASGGSLILGGDGDDLITGGPGADTIMGGLGSDAIDGMGGADSIYGNSDVDLTDTNQNFLSGGDGNDLIEGTDRVDTIDGGRGSDDIFGHQGSDVIDGFQGSDFINGGAGADEIRGGLGLDEIIGGPGNDIIFGEDGADMLFGGTGTDTISGGSGNDTILGQGGADDLSGNGGADSISGGTGDDELQGGTGNDTLNGQGGNDILLGQGGDDQFTGGLGLDSFNGGLGIDTATDIGEAGEVSIEN